MAGTVVDPQEVLTRLHEAAETTSDGQKELLVQAAAAISALAEDLAQQNLVRPSAWANREQKYKHDLQELRRQLTIMEESHAKLTKDLKAASSGTLVQQLREEIKTLEASNAEHKAARAELTAKLADLTARTHTLVQSSTQASNTWREICSKKAPMLESLRSFNSSHSGNGTPGPDGAAVPQQDTDDNLLLMTPTTNNATIVVEHLSVSGAKAKLEKQQQLHAQTGHTPLQSRDSMERRTTSGTLPATPEIAAITAVTGSGSPTAAEVASQPQGDLLDLLGSPVAAATATAAAADDGDDSQLMDIDDLLGMGSGKVTPAPATANGHVTHVELLDGATQTALPTTFSDAFTDMPVVQLVDTGVQGGAVLATVDAGTDADAWLPSTQTDESRFSAAEVQVQLPAEGAEVAVQVSPTASDAGVQASVDREHRESQTGAELQLAAEVSHAEQQTEAAAPAATTEAASQGERVELVAADVQTEVAGLDAHVSQEPAGLPAAAQQELEQRLQAAEAALATAKEEAAGTAAAAAAAQASLDSTAAELAAVREQHTAAQQQVERLQQQVTELQATVEQQQSQLESAAADHEKQRSLPPAVDPVLTERIVQLENLVATKTQEVEEARAAAVRSAKALAQAQEQLSTLQETQSLLEVQLHALREKEEKMGLEIQAYEHTMAGLKLAVEEADVDRQVHEAQAVEMAEKLAYLTEFVAVKAKNPKLATMDYPSWLKKRQKQKAAAPPPLPPDAPPS